MLKHSILFSFALLLTFFSFGQNFKISKVKKLISSGNINPETGFLLMENKKGGLNNKTFTLSFLKNKSKNPGPNITFTVETSDYYTSCTFNKEKVFIWFVSSESFQNKVFVCNPSSKKAEIIEVYADKNIPLRYGNIEENHFLLAQSWKDKNQTVLMGYNPSFKKNWEFFELTKIPVKGFFITQNRLFVVTESSNGESITQSFTEINYSNGQPLSSYVLPGSQNSHIKIVNDVYVLPSTQGVAGFFTDYAAKENETHYIYYNFTSQKKVEFSPVAGEVLPFIHSHGLLNTANGYCIVGENYQINSVQKSKIIQNRYKEVQYRELAIRQKEINMMDRKIQDLQREKDANSGPEITDPNVAMERIMKIETETQILLQQKNEDQRKLNDEKAKIDALPSESDTIIFNEYTLQPMNIFYGEISFSDELLLSKKISKKTHEKYKTDDFPNTFF